jgi:predicted DNA binding CopG/RHH family protein
MPTARISIDAPRSLHAALKRGASNAGLPMAEYVRRAISEKLKTQPTPSKPAPYRNQNT